MLNKLVMMVHSGCSWISNVPVTEPPVSYKVNSSPDESL